MLLIVCLVHCNYIVKTFEACQYNFILAKNNVKFTCLMLPSFLSAVVENLLPLTAHIIWKPVKVGKLPQYTQLEHLCPLKPFKASLLIITPNGCHNYHGIVINANILHNLATWVLYL